jgi:hypothetical protein
VTHLRQIMIEELQRRNFAESTIRTYLHGVEHFSRYFHRRPDQLGPEHIRKYPAALFTECISAARTLSDCAWLFAAELPIAFQAFPPQPILICDTRECTGEDQAYPAGTKGDNSLKANPSRTVTKALCSANREKKESDSYPCSFEEAPTVGCWSFTLQPPLHLCSSSRFLRFRPNHGPSIPAETVTCICLSNGLRQLRPLHLRTTNRRGSSSTTE